MQELRRFSITLVSPARAERTCESIRRSVRFDARGHAMEVETFSRIAFTLLNVIPAV